jgi:hypothetical protein
VVTLTTSIAAPAAFLATGSLLLRLQSSRLRRGFAEAARDFDPPGLRTVVHPPGARTPQSPAADTATSDTATIGTAAPGDDADTPTDTAASLVVLGDSWLAGSAPADPARLLSRGLASLLGMPVHLTALAEPSARAESLSTQIDRALADPHLTERGGPRIAVLSMGTADILFPVTGSITLGVLSSALSRLQRAGFATVLLCCPNLSSLPGIRNPLRTVMRRSSRVLAGSQWLAALSAGAMPLSLTRILSGTSHIGLVDESGLRPSQLGRRQLAAAVLRAIADRLDLPRRSTPTPEDA